MSGAKADGAQRYLPAERDLAALAEAAAGCQGCELYRAADRTVFGEGAEHAAIMLVGEQPGDAEDREGRPFVGPAGRLLDRALSDSGIDRSTTYVTNAVKHFSFTVRGKRRMHQTPRAAHISACRPWLKAELEAVRPRLVICLGGTAVKSVLGGDIKVMRDRGRIVEHDTLLDDDGGSPDAAFLVTVHPSAVLRVPDERRHEAYAALVDDLRAAEQFCVHPPKKRRSGATT